MEIKMDRMTEHMKVDASGSDWVIAIFLFYKEIKNEKNVEKTLAIF